MGYVSTVSFSSSSLKEGGRKGWVPSKELRRFVEGEGGREAEQMMTPLNQKEGALITEKVLPPSLPLPPLICFDMGSCVEVGLKTAEEWEGWIEGVVRTLRRVFPSSSGRGGGGGGGEGGAGSRDENEKREGGGANDGFRLLLLHFPPRPLTTVKEEEEQEADGGERKKRRVDEQQQQQQQQRQKQQQQLSNNMLRLPLEEYVPHSWLFPRCHLVLHHGGLGSTMACIGGGRGGGAATAAATAGAAAAAAAAAGEEEVAAGAGMTTECVQGGGGGGGGGWEGGRGGGGGVPQLVLPCTEEQRVWGERAAYLGLGAVVGREGGREGGVEDDVCQALERLEEGREECLKTIKQYAGWLGEEDGVGRAVEVLIEEMMIKKNERDKKGFKKNVKNE